MRKLLAISAIFIGIAPVTALAQSTGPRDGTANVPSDRIGAPGTINDPMAQYQSQRALNNLPAQDARRLRAKAGPARPARTAELTAGAAINDRTGLPIAKIDKIDPDGVIVSTASGKVKIPAAAFGHNDAGLLLDMTKAQFEQIVAKANAAS